MPVINPLYFYAIELIENLKYVLVTVILILVLFDFLVVLLLLAENGFDIDETFDFLKTNHIAKRWTIAIIAIVAILIFIPSKTTMYEMLIAKNVTVQRLEKLHKLTKHDIIDIIKQIEKESE